ncbi:MAG: hypothetical protein N2748_04315 [candidate division WOR-3 bacterium]|nr:hypothetical protein [candidate division WOR-3 bacterium]
MSQISAELTYYYNNQGGPYREIIKDAVKIKPPSVLWLVLKFAFGSIKTVVKLLAKKLKGRR